MRRGTVVVLTGSFSGIGRATALELAAHGASLVSAARHVVALQDHARECRDAGAQAIERARDIHVGTVLPSGIDTPLFHHAANSSGRVVKAPDPVYAPCALAHNHLLRHGTISAAMRRAARPRRRRS